MDGIELGSVVVGSTIILYLLGATAVKAWKDRAAQRETEAAMQRHRQETMTR